MKAALCAMLLLLLTCPCSYCGDLDKFESDATKHGNNSSSSSRSRGDSDCGLLDLIFDILTAPFRYSSSGYSGHEDGPRIPLLSPVDRVPGDPLIPEVRFDVLCQDVESDIVAAGYSLEIGRGRLGAELRQTHYMEGEPADTLDIYQMHLLLRSATVEGAEIDFAVGAVIVDGNEGHSGFSCGLPMRLWPREYFGFEFRPIWSDINGTWTTDCDLSILLRYDLVSLRLGYRWVESPQESLNGPQIGLSMRY